MATKPHDNIMVQLGGNTAGAAQAKPAPQFTNPVVRFTRSFDHCCLALPRGGRYSKRRFRATIMLGRTPVELEVPGEIKDFSRKADYVVTGRLEFQGLSLRGIPQFRARFILDPAIEPRLEVRFEVPHADSAPIGPVYARPIGLGRLVLYSIERLQAENASAQQSLAA